MEQEVLSTMNKGRLIVFSAPSGCGKGTMLAEIVKNKKFWCSISATTRFPRNGEIDGVDYHFMTRDEFEKRIANNEFLEYAEYCQNYYGTILSEVDEKIEKGIDVILEIEVQGAMKIKEKRPDAIFVFIAPPSVGELRRRLKKRGTEPDEIIDERVSKATEEIMLAKNYDYVIVNDALEDAIEDFFAVMRAERLKIEFSAELIDEVINNA